MKYRIPEAVTSNKEMSGTITIDWETKNGLLSFVESLNIDTKKYQPLALYYKNNSKVKLVLYAIDMSIVDKTAESIHDYVIKHLGSIPVVKFNLTHVDDLSFIRNYLSEWSIIVTKQWEDIEIFEEVREVNI